MKLKHKNSMNYGNAFQFCIEKISIAHMFLFHFIFAFSRAGVPEKYCIDIERKINGPMGLNTETTTNTSAVH